MTGRFLTLSALIALTAGAAQAQSWSLDGDASALVFGSVKNDYIGEVHRFDALSGRVAENGAATITIALGSIETMIDIRNERMIEHVFDFAKEASITGQIDMQAVSGLDDGATLVLPLEAELSFLGNTVDLTPDMFIVRIGEDKVMATTEDMVFLSTDDLGIDAGVDTLQQIAGLSSITRAVPVAMRLVFDRDGSAN